MRKPVGTNQAKLNQKTADQACLGCNSQFAVSHRKQLVALGLAGFAVLCGLVMASTNFDSLPTDVLSYSAWVLFFGFGLFVVARAQSPHINPPLALRMLAMMAMGVWFVSSGLWQGINGLATYANGIVGILLILVLAFFVTTICYAGSLFVVIGVSFNLLPVRTPLIIVRLLLIALGAGFVMTLMANLNALLLQALPADYLTAILFLDGFSTQIVFGFAYYFVINSFLGTTRPIGGLRAD